jgi:hypothetical protein
MHFADGYCLPSLSLVIVIGFPQLAGAQEGGCPDRGEGKTVTAAGKQTAA